jgi:hypothetical protein
MYKLLAISGSDENISAGTGILKKNGLSESDSSIELKKDSDNFGFSPLSV